MAGLNLKRRTSLFVSAAFIASSGATASWAQDSTAAASASAQGDATAATQANGRPDDNTIIVTAQRRAQALIQVPQSVSVVSGDTLERQMAYWRQALAGAPALIELPSDRPRPPVASRQGAGIGLTIPADLTAGILDLSRREGATLFMTLLAALDLVLARWSGQDDIVVGAPIAGRAHAEIEGLVGFFLNNLVLRVRVDDPVDLRVREHAAVPLGADHVDRRESAHGKSSGPNACGSTSRNAIGPEGVSSRQSGPPSS